MKHNVKTIQDKGFHSFNRDLNLWQGSSSLKLINEKKIVCSKWQAFIFW